MNSLSEFEFQNLVLEERPERARFRVGGTLDAGLVQAPQELYLQLAELFARTNGYHVRNLDQGDFLIEFQARRYRVNVINPGIFSLRKAAVRVPSLADCRLHPMIFDYLMGLKAGTVFFFGGFSTGKTTICSSYLVEKVRHDAGLGIALEDPPELPLEGDHGGGRIYQKWISRQDIAARTEEIMRANFDVSMFSELRTPLMCQVFLLAGLAGRLSMTTGHGGSIVEGLHRVVSLAASINSGGELGAMAIRSQLAESFQAAILMKQVGGRYVPSSYLLRDDSVVATIRANDLNALNNNVDQIMRQLQVSNRAVAGARR